MDTSGQMPNNPYQNAQPEPRLIEEPKVKQEVKIEDDLIVSAELIPKHLKPCLTFDPKQELDELPDDEIRVLAKEAAAKLGRECLRRIHALMAKQVMDFPEWGDWVMRYSDISDQGGIPRILVGVVGMTGAGKSTLINALLAEEFVVPCNAMMAHTAVPVEVAYNTSDDLTNPYRAEIVFISLQKWHDVIDFLLQEIKASPNNLLITDLDADTSIAYNKVAAIYPGVSLSSLATTTRKKLLNSRNLTTIIGQTIRINESSMEKLFGAVKRYIVSGNTDSKDEKTYWPMVQAVNIFAKIDLLKTGLVLVDLPGLGDSNAARAGIAERYLKNLRHMWIVENIVRAVDSKIASDLLGRKFQTQLSLDGHYHDDFITFVMTWADVIPTNSVMESLQLENSVLKKEVEEEKRLNTLKNKAESRLSEIKQERRTSQQRQGSSKAADLGGRKRKRDGQEELYFAEYEEIKRDLKKLNKYLTKLNNAMKATCIAQRNSWVRERIQEQFNSGLNKLQHGMEDEDDPPMAISNSQVNKVNTFCVSANAYQQLSGRMKRENSTHEFPTLSHTNIPSLQEFVKKCTFQDRERIADKTLTELNLLKWSIRPWADGKEVLQLSAVELEKLRGEVNTLGEELQQKTLKIGNNSIQRIGTAIKSKIHARLTESVQATTVTSLNEAEKIRMSNIYAAQWKAICRRKGIPYKSFDWVETFTAPFALSFAADWKFLFEVKIPELLRLHASSIIEALNHFRTDLTQSVNEIRGEQPHVEQLLSQLPLLEDLVKERVAEALEYSEACARDANREAAPVIKLALGPLYDKLIDITDKGMLNKSKAELCDFIEEQASERYGHARDTIHKGLKKMCAALNKKLKTVAEDVEGKLHGDFKAMLNSMDQGELTNRMEEKKKVLQSVVTTELGDLEDAWADLVKDPLKDLRARNPLQRIENIQDLSSDAEDSDFDYESESDFSDSDDEGAEG